MQCPGCHAELKEGATCECGVGTPEFALGKTVARIQTNAAPSQTKTAVGHLASFVEPGAQSEDISIDATLLGVEGSVAVATEIRPEETSEKMSNAMLGQVLGSYRLLDILGEGGMGRVYLAEHTKIGRRVALKMLHTHLAKSPDVVRRFFDEARAVNRILHEHIVEITDFIENEDGANYFIMEYLRGAALADMMEGEDDGTSPLARALGIGTQVASALSAVHSANIVHRDLKPENIFLTQRGGQKNYVKLLDFGIAKLVGDHGEGMRLQQTQAGVIMGTPEYMSPEQASAIPVDHRTDIYSLGIILYELCTGQLPFSADNFGDIVVLHKTQKPLPPRKVPDLQQPIPPPLEELILHCLEKDPDDRPQTSKEVEERLHEIAWGFAVELEQFEFADVSYRPSGGKKGKLWMLGGGGLAAAAVAVFLLLSSGASSDESSPSAVAVAESSAKQELRVAAEAPQAQVALSFLSEPPGAMVYPAGEPRLLGVTPFTLSFEQSDEVLHFEFRKVGFEDSSQEITPVTTASLNTVLVAVPELPPSSAKAAVKKRSKKRAKTTKKKGRPGALKRGGVMNPFD